MKKYIFGILFGILLTLFTLYVVLDAFVIVRVYEPIGSTTENDVTLEIPEAEPVVTETSYSDENISIEITTHRAYDTDIYVADVKLASVDYLKCAFAKDTFGKNITEKTSEIASSKDAIFAVNGDFYGAQNDGYVIRNGVLYRANTVTNKDALVIGADGSFEIILEKDVPAESLFENGARHVFSFGPGLLINGELAGTIDRYKGNSLTSNPRTAIGIIDELHYVFVVCDGRTSESRGLSVKELAKFMQTLNVKCAYNLDGGGSTTMFFNGRVVNKPTTYGDKFEERSVSDIVYIGYR